MTEAQRRRRLQLIARRVKFMEGPSVVLDPEAIEELATTQQRALAQAGAKWVAHQGMAEGRYGRPFWRGRW